MVSSLLDGYCRTIGPSHENTTPSVGTLGVSETGAEKYSSPKPKNSHPKERYAVKMGFGL